MPMCLIDSTRPETKKFLTKNFDTFFCEVSNRIGLGKCVMEASTNLCLAFFEFGTVLENKRVLSLSCQVRIMRIEIHQSQRTNVHKNSYT